MLTQVYFQCTIDLRLDKCFGKYHYEIIMKVKWPLMDNHVHQLHNCLRNNPSSSSVQKMSPRRS